MKPVAFGSLFELIRNGVSLKQDPSFGGTPVTRIETISTGRVDPSKVGYAGVAAEELPQHVLADGDILFSHINSPAHVGKCALYCSEPRVLIHGMNLLRLRCRPDADPRFVRHLIESPPFKASLQRYVNRAVNQASISVRNLSAIEVSVPQLAEQQRIASMLDLSRALIQRNSEVRGHGRSLIASVFRAMFGDPGDQRSGWRRMPIGDLATVITGNTPPRADPGNYGTHLEWVKSDNLGRGSIYVGKASEGLSRAGTERARVVGSGAVLVTCIAGSPASIGNLGLTNRRVAFNQQINAVVPATMDARFLYAQLGVGQRLIQAASTGGMKGMVSKSSLQSVTLIVPPQPMQLAFGARFEEIVRLQATLNARAGSLNALFGSLQERAFTSAP